MIFDGPDMAMPIGEVIGDKEYKHINDPEHPLLTQSISNSGMMFIQFKRYKPVKNPENKYDVAELKALIKYNTFMPECQTWLDLEKNTLISPDKYGNNFNCSWLLSYNFGSYIKLTFDHIYVSSNLL